MNYITSAHQAELNAAAKMREWGFIDATATTGGSDGGIDVRSRKALAQVKWRGGVAGRPDLQLLVGARGTDTDKQLMFFAASGYSKQAVEYAKSMGIALYTYDPTGAVQAVSGSATRPTSWSVPWRPSERLQTGLLLIVGLLAALVLMSLVWTTNG
ncbi:restriction endonuclease [Williamsia sterculiae]|uniref:Restriction endonuclease n=1 Tax=Williamsia sterculiae TaxID=1344003 RepID=A0A1N7GFT3_9NOCA|nr:restriction endonuclease [Williamsia sterculiae]SIS11467.1 Restriction endonuclease [Williamsia sterculiae]